MIYRFTLISDEADDFIREIQIDPEATFYDFHEAIVKSVGYTDDQMTSFFICDDDWEKEKEVTLEEMDDNPEIDSWVMKDTQVSELVEDEKQKLLYVFDYMTERCFFIELSEIITGKNMTGAKCTKKAGEAPKQTVDFEEMAAASGSLDLDESFYGDQDFEDKRIFVISKAFRAGYTIDQVHELTKIDKWFLQKLMNIMQTSKELRQLTIDNGQLTMRKEKEAHAIEDPQGNCHLSTVNCQLL